MRKRDRSLIELGTRMATPSTRYIPYEKTVTINNAPTEKSVELLNEYKEEARKQIVKDIRIKDNIINGSCTVFKEPMGGMTCIFKALVNGEQITTRETIDDICLAGDDDVYKKLVSMVIEQLVVKTIALASIERHSVR